MDLRVNLVTFFLMVITHTYVEGYRRGCESPQYLKIGRAETIICSFKDNFDSINWYFNLDVTDGPPTVSYENQLVRGEGYESGEFDIREDGSLIIKNVSVQHETMFTVYEVETADDLPIRHDIDIVTIARPDPPYPMIDGCSSSRGLCYRQWNEGTPLVCRISHARPAQHLTMVTRTGEIDIRIRTSTDLFNHTNTWTSSISVINPFMYSSYLALIICKAESEINLLMKNESKILVQNKDMDMSSFEIAQVAVQRNHMMRLPCPEGDYQLLVWEKIYPNGESTAVIVDINTKGIISNETNGYKLQEGNLVIDKIAVNHEGLYRCIYSSKNDEEVVKQLNVTVYVTPVPNVPIVEGCPNDRYCVLELTYQGTLTCHVRGIRPEIKLEWRTYHEETKKMISFNNQQMKTILNGDTSDITLITDYTVIKTAVKRLTLECRAVGLNSQYFTLNTQVDLLFSPTDDQNTTEIMSATTVPGHGHFNKTSLIAACVIIGIILVIITIVVLLRCKVHDRNKKRPARNDEHIPMMNNEDKNKKTVFISQLKSTYANLYNALKPIPFFDEHCTVDELFVEGGIEFTSKAKTLKRKWEVLDSYKDIFTHPKLLHNHWIIEGGPGYGKSTLCLQLAYEWCHGVNGSFMSGIDLLILIRLRQLKGVSSIYEAIKLFCLPKDSEVSIDDIKTNISESTSVLIILDGFDEYPDSDSDTKSDVFEILKRHILPDCRVVITTRPSRLPKDDTPQANYLKLTGFQAEAQERYLHKVVTFNGQTTTTYIVQEWLEGNPVLRDLLEVPLFFVMYSHLTLEHDLLTKCTSVTTFFRFVITCLHAHCKRKQKDEKVESFHIDENEHQNLDKFCFSKLNGHTYNPSVEKSSLSKELGQGFVEMYLKIGIFQEEDIIEITDDPGIQTQHVLHVTYVKLYHSLFCEWYAAHYLVKKLNAITDSFMPPVNDEKEAILERLDSQQLQYVYRFACGLDSNSAEHILDYFNQAVKNTAFSILCILEQFGNVDAILKNVREVCNETVSIRNGEPRIVQKSVIKLLEIAASKMLTIPKLVLVDCFRSVNSYGSEIILYSEIRLPVLNCVNCLWLEQQETELTQEDLDDVYKYALKCQTLSEISFVYSLTPYIFKVESTLKKLHQKDMKVLWYVMNKKYILDLSSGIWKKITADASEITVQEYKNIEKMFRLMSH